MKTIFLLGAITWDFGIMTAEFSGLGSALATAGGIATGAALVLYGIKRAVEFVLGLFTRTASYDEENESDWEDEERYEGRQRKIHGID